MILGLKIQQFLNAIKTNRVALLVVRNGHKES